MPVRLKDHDPDLGFEPGTAKSAVVALLYDNPDLGYKPKEVHERLDIPHSTSKVTLKRLYDDGDVGKTADGYYHALDGREDLRRYAATVEQRERMFDAPTDLDEADEAYTPETSESEAEAQLDALEAELDEQ